MDTVTLFGICHINGIKFKQNHYEQFGWDDNPVNEYVWPK